MQRGRECRRICAWWLRFAVNYMAFLHLLRFDISELERQLPRHPYILVANHPSLIDVMFLMSAQPRLCVIAKGSIFKSSLVGTMLRLCHHIDAGDGSPAAGRAVVAGAVDRLRSGDPVLIFPEGTRSPAGGLHPLKTGAFRIAAIAGVSVVPVLIRSDPRTLMKGVPWYTVPDRTVVFTIDVLPEFPTAKCQGDRKALTAEMTRLYERLLGLDRARREAAAEARAERGDLASGGGVAVNG